MAPEADNNQHVDQVEVETEKFSGSGAIGEVERAHARTTQVMAITILSMAFTIFLLHCGLIFFLVHKRPDSVEAMSRVFEIWIPTFVGLLGSAAGFYFGDRKK